MDASTSIASFRRRLRTALAVIALTPLAFAAPATSLAAEHGGMGGGHFGGGGHASFGGHFSTPHVGATHFAAQHFSAPRAVATVHYGYSGNGGYRPTANFAAQPGYAGGGANHYAAPYGHVAPNYQAGYAARGGYYAHGVAGRYIPGHAFNYGYWHGGYWRGGYWPAVYWGAGFPWFLPAIPAIAVAYWWNSVPYYYCNNVYYTYDPSQSGYVVTTPPPADQSGPPAQAPGAADTSYSEAPAADTPAAESEAIPSGAPTDGAPNANTGGIGNLYAYPKNGQSDEQQSQDRQQCAQWASGQTSSDGTGTAGDYQRALTACLQGRGYSVD